MNIITFDKENTAATLYRLFQESDFISIHLSEEPSSERLIDRKFIFSMRPKAWLINTARASVIDEKCLLWALKSQAIGGAACDVVEDPDLDRFIAPNFINTPHVAGRALEDRIATDKFIIEKLLNIMGQKPLPRKIL